jgi:hypothetical protein
MAALCSTCLSKERRILHAVKSSHNNTSVKCEKKTLQGTKQDQPDLRISDSDLTIQKVCPRPCESVSAPGEPRTLAQQGPVTVLAVL